MTGRYPSTMLLHRLPNYLKTYRRRSGFTQEEVDYLLGAPTNADVGRYERRAATPDLDKALALAKILGQPVERLFAGRNETIGQQVQQRAGTMVNTLSRQPSRPIITKKIAAFTAVVGSRYAPNDIMKGNHPMFTRIMAVDPTHRGFGFAVLEREGNEKPQLIDWGVAGCTFRSRGRCLTKLTDMLAHYLPSVVVFEKCVGRQSIHCRSVQTLLRGIERTAAKRRIKIRTGSWDQVRSAFPGTETKTKHAIAAEIARLFPELAPRLPKPRVWFESEDYRMGMFDAVGLGLIVQPQD